MTRSSALPSCCALKDAVGAADFEAVPAVMLLQLRTRADREEDGNEMK